VGDGEAFIDASTGMIAALNVNDAGSSRHTSFTSASSSVFVRVSLSCVRGSVSMFLHDIEASNVGPTASASALKEDAMKSKNTILNPYGIVILAGSGTNDEIFTFEAPLMVANAVLSNVTFTPLKYTYGTASSSLTITVNDLNNGGFQSFAGNGLKIGHGLEDSKTIYFNVLKRNNPPEITLPAQITSSSGVIKSTDHASGMHSSLNDDSITSTSKTFYVDVGAVIRISGAKYVVPASTSESYSRPFRGSSSNQHNSLGFELWRFCELSFSKNTTQRAVQVSSA